MKIEDETETTASTPQKQLLVVTGTLISFSFSTADKAQTRPSHGDLELPSEPHLPGALSLTS